MATTPTNNPNVDPTLLKKQLKEILEDQGDYNNLLKQSVLSLNRVEQAYAKISAKLNTLNKDSINIKDINNEIVKLAQKEYIEKRSLQLLEKEMAASGKSNTVAAYASAKRQYELGKDGLAYLKKKGDLEAISMFTAYQRTKVAEQETAIANEYLENEKKVSKQLGISGNLMKIFATNLGVGEEAYSAMTLKARKFVDINGEVTNPSKWKVAAAGVSSIFKSLTQSIFDPAVITAATVKMVSAANSAITSGLSKISGTTAGLTDVNVIQKATSGVSNLVKNIPLVGGLLGGVVDIFASFLDLAIGAASQVQKMGRELGLSRKEAQNLNNEFSNFANNSSDVLLNSRKLFETQIELGKSLGVMNVLSNDRLQTDIHLKEVAGLELDTRTSLVESSVILGKNQKDIMNSVFAQVKGLKNATGIQLDQKAVLKEASSLGGYLGLSFAKYPAQLTKSLISIKAMGLELKQLDSMADSFLDFESSISNEFEAQLLTGKDINLSKARELFLNNDLAAAAQEITSQVGSSSEFLSMNRVQAESMAKAFGMSRDQMGDMLKKQEYMSKIGAKDTDNAQKQYQLALAKYGTQKDMAAALGEETTQNIMNANAQEKIAGFMDKIKQGFIDLISNSQITGFIDKAINWLSQPSNIEGIINKLQGFFHTVLAVTGSVIGGIMKFLNYLPGINIDSDLIDTVSNLGDTFQPGSVGSLSSTKIKSQETATAKAIASPTTAMGNTANVNLKIEQKQGDSPGKMLYRVVNEDTGQKTDWQTGIIGLT